MKTLSIISKFILILKIIVIAGATFAVIALSIMYANDSIVNIGNPMWEIVSATTLDQTRSLFQQDESIQIETVLLKLEVPMSFGLIASIFIFLAAFVVYTFIALHIMSKIVREVREQRPFTYANAKRIKYLGILVGFIPILNAIGSNLFGLWIESYYRFEGLDIYLEKTNSMPFFIIGALIYVLGVSFDQGVKMQEEQALTI